MTDLAGLLPLAIVLGVTAVAVIVAVIVVRVLRRGSRARAAALAERSRAAASVAGLDDAITDFDLDLALSGALVHPAAPPTLRRARMTAQHARDDGYAELRASGVDGSPVDIRRAARLVTGSSVAAAAALERARVEHDRWLRGHATPPTLIAAARTRLAETRAALGDPAALTRELQAFDAAEWRDAAEAADDAGRAADEAAARLDAAEALAGDAAADPRTALAAAERAVRRAVADERVLEETHRIVMDAARAVPGELAAAEAAVNEALEARRALPRGEADRVASEAAEATAILNRLKSEGTRRPVAAVHAIAALRSRLDEAAGGGLTSQQRVRSARTSLPGTLAAARAVIAHAEARLRRDAAADADGEVRLLLVDAQHHLAVARGADDVIGALTAARKAVGTADRAVARIDSDE